MLKFNRLRRSFSSLSKHYQNGESVSNHNFLLFQDMMIEYEKLQERRDQFKIQWQKDKSQSKGLNTINRYFKIRKEVGFQEELLSDLMNQLAEIQEQKKDDSTGKDVMGKYFFNSLVFQSIMKDVNLMFHPTFETNSQCREDILKNLSRMGFKDRKTVIQACNKVIGELNQDLKSNEFILEGHKDITFTKTYHEEKILKDKMQKFLQKILDFKQITEPPKDVIDFDEEGQEKGNFALSLSRVSVHIFRSKRYLYNLFDTLQEIRKNYFTLKKDQQKKLIDQNQDFLLDFKQLEEDLLKYGVLLPSDIISKTNKNQKFEKLIYKQFMLENFVNSDFIHEMNDNYDFEEENMSVSEMVKKGREFQRVKNLKSFYQLVKNCLNQVFNVNKEETYADPRINYIMMDQSHSKPTDFYFTQNFQDILKIFQEFLQKTDFEEYGNFEKLIIQAIKNQLLIGESGEEEFEYTQDMIDFVVENLDSFNKNQIEDFLGKVDHSLISEDSLYGACLNLYLNPQKIPQIYQESNIDQLNNTQENCQLHLINLEIIKSKDLSQDHLFKVKELMNKFKIIIKKNKTTYNPIENKIRQIFISMQQKSQNEQYEYLNPLLTSYNFGNQIFLLEKPGQKEKFLNFYQQNQLKKNDENLQIFHIKEEDFVEDDNYYLNYDFQFKSEIYEVINVLETANQDHPMVFNLKNQFSQSPYLFFVEKILEKLKEEKDQECKDLLLKQLIFFCERENLKDQIDSLKKQIKNFERQEIEDFSGKREFYDILNFDVIKQNKFSIFEEWKGILEKLNEDQFYEKEERIYMKYSSLNMTKIPDLRDLSQNELTKDELWKLSLLNLSFILRSNLNEKFIQKFLSQSWIKKLIKNLNQDKINSKIFHKVNSKQLLMENNNEYMKSVEEIKNLEDILSSLKEDIEINIPKFCKNDQNFENLLLEKKKEYRRKLSEYQKLISSFGSMDKSQDYKDYIFQLINNPKEKFQSSLQQDLTTQGFVNFINLNQSHYQQFHQGCDKKIEDIFSREDFEYFEQFFPECALKEFKKEKIEDLAVMVGIHFNSENQIKNSVKEYIQSHLSSSLLNQQDLKIIEMAFDVFPNHSQNIKELKDENEDILKSREITLHQRSILKDIITIDASGNYLSKKWLVKDKQSLSQAIDQCNQQSQYPLDEINNCKLKRFTKKII